MYIHNIHILYYVPILYIRSNIKPNYCLVHKRMPEHKKVISKDIKKEFKAITY